MARYTEPYVPCPSFSPSSTTPHCESEGARAASALYAAPCCNLAFAAAAGEADDEGDAHDGDTSARPAPETRKVEATSTVDIRVPPSPMAPLPSTSPSLASSLATTSAFGVCGTARGLMLSTGSRFTAPRLILKPVEAGLRGMGAPSGVPPRVLGTGAEAGESSSELSENPDALRCGCSGVAKIDSEALDAKCVASMASYRFRLAVRHASRAAPSEEEESKADSGRA
mmetsp:Transcript_1277/g.4077  ORF Transcript_1277/g.4077 Transcript_1277/m.4077 type:complete len:227 (-) Transcript_1277:2237-2917(-)